ncbi:nuclease [Leptospira sp. 201903071]|uniref:DUF1016 N-terminal domain-containing protein n=1 Tax=Leptospira ainazelensis TaxID=2810034 RepID=UPI00196498C2|nr:DUF1016 N-terminal domain-containing protein [Leptospira ainazelensis]MBM9502374.1 nuclease [Leptospira ainazelensis]
MNPSDLKEALEKILNTYEEMRRLSDQSGNSVILETNREIGRILASTERKVSSEEKQSGSWMQAISHNLQKQLKKGFSERTLFYCRKFYEIYKDKDLDGRLSWSHYRTLCTIENPTLRSKVEREVAQNNWNREELQKRLRDLSGIKERKVRTKWKRPEGELWHYRIKESGKMGVSYLLDLGFYCYYEIPEKKSKTYKEGDILKIKKEKGNWNLEKVSILRSKDIYFYSGELERVIDGDTILVKLDLGFNILSRQRIRLRNVWSSEMDTQKGYSSFESLKKKLPAKTKLIVRSRSKDIYGRYVGDVLYAKKKTMTPEEIIHTGNYLNSELSSESE